MDIDTSKELVIYQNKFWLTLWIVMILLIGCSPLIIGAQAVDQNKITMRYMLAGASVIISLIISRQLFIKSPLLRVNNGGFFTRKTGDISWNDVSDMSLTAGAPYGSSLISIKLKDGKSFIVNPSSMRPPSEGNYIINRGFEIFEIKNSYRKIQNK